MIELVSLEILVLNAATFIVGAWAMSLAWRAYRRTGQRNLFALTFALILLTVAGVSEAIVYQGLGWAVQPSRLFASALTLAAFCTLLYSLYR